MRERLVRLRPWLAPAGGILILAALAPPLGGYAQRYEFVQALQFVIFAAAGPALLVLGAPARARWLPSRSPAAGQPAAGQPAVRRAAAGLLAFIVLVIAWRLPVSVNAVARHPALAVLELMTLVAAGSLIWRELTAASSSPARLTRPQRAALAALAMWTCWAVAYITGMAEVSPFPASATAVTGGMSFANDRQLAAAILWAVPALSFVPVIFTMVMTWLGEREDPDRELREASAAIGMPRPPRGWRTPAA